MRWRAAGTAALLLLAGAIEAVSAEPSAGSEPPPGPGLELIRRSCVNCHDLYTILQKRRTPEEWANMLGLMADRGAEVTPPEMKVIRDYLVHNFAPGSTP